MARKMVQNFISPYMELHVLANIANLQHPTKNHAPLSFTNIRFAKKIRAREGKIVYEIFVEPC